MNGVIRYSGSDHVAFFTRAGYRTEIDHFFNQMTDSAHN